MRLAGCGELRGDSSDRDAGRAPAEGGEEGLGWKRPSTARSGPHRPGAGGIPRAVSSSEGVPGRAAARPPWLRADQEQLLPNAGWVRGAADAASAHGPAHGPAPGGRCAARACLQTASRSSVLQRLLFIYPLALLCGLRGSAPQPEADPCPLQWTLGGLTSEPAGNCPCSSGSYTFTAHKISISLLKIFLYFSYLPIPLSLFYHSFHIALYLIILHKFIM